MSSEFSVYNPNVHEPEKSKLMMLSMHSLLMRAKNDPQFSAKDKVMYNLLLGAWDDFENPQTLVDNLDHKYVHHLRFVLEEYAEESEDDHQNAHWDKWLQMLNNRLEKDFKKNGWDFYCSELDR